MAKARPSLDITARPVSTFVAPNQNAVAAELYDQQAVQNALQFADAFSNLSVSAARLAGALKQEWNEEEILKGQDLVNQSRRSYQQLVSEGQIKPTENPWFAIGAQKASGTMEAAKARANFETLLEKKIQEDPNFLDDPRGFDAFAYQYTQNVNQFIGDASYMSRAFYESFNPFVGAMQAKHEQRVVEHNNKKIFDGASAAIMQAVYDLSELPVPFDVIEIAPDSEQTTINDELRQKYEQARAKEKELTARLKEIEASGQKRGRQTLRELEESVKVTDELMAQLKVIIEIDELRGKKETPVPGGARTIEVLQAAQKKLDEFALSGVPSNQVNMVVANSLIEEMKSGENPKAALFLLSKLTTGTGKLFNSKEVSNAFQRALPEIVKNESRLTDAEFNRVTEVISKQVMPQVLSGYLSYDEGAETVRKEASKYTGAKGVDSLLSRYESDYNRAKAQQEKVFQQSQSDAIYSILTEAQTNPDRDALMQKIKDLKLPPEQLFRATELFNREFDAAAETRQLNATIQATNTLWVGTGQGDGLFPNIDRELDEAAKPGSTSIPSWGPYDRAIKDFTTDTLGLQPSQDQFNRVREDAFVKISRKIDEWEAKYRPAPGDNPETLQFKQQMGYKATAMRMTLAAQFDDPRYLSDIYKSFYEELNPQAVETDRPLPATELMINAFMFARDNNNNIDAILPTGENGKEVVKMLEYAAGRVRRGEDLRAVAQDVSSMRLFGRETGKDPFDVKNPLKWVDQFGGDQDSTKNIVGALEDIRDFAKASSPTGQLETDAVPYMDYAFRTAWAKAIQDNGMASQYAYRAAKEQLLNDHVFVRGSMIPRTALGDKNEAFLEAFLDVNFPNNPNATFVVVSLPGARETLLGVRENGQPLVNKFFRASELTRPDTPEGRKVFDAALDKAVLGRKTFTPLTTGQALTGWLWNNQ